MQTTGLILAGGRGMRMGQVDKGLQRLQGKAMVAHVLQRLTPQVDRVLINANQNLPSYAAFGVPVYADQLSGYAGPLAGLQTGLMQCSTPFLVSAPCDSPFLPLDLVARLHAGLAASAAEIAVACTGPASQRQAQPVFCLVSTSLLPHLTHYLESGGRKFDGWYATLKVAQVHFIDDEAFRNINTINELQQFQ